MHFHSTLLNESAGTPLPRSVTCTLCPWQGHHRTALAHIWGWQCNVGTRDQTMRQYEASVSSREWSEAAAADWQLSASCCLPLSEGESSWPWHWGGRSWCWLPHCSSVSGGRRGSCLLPAAALSETHDQTSDLSPSLCFSVVTSVHNIPVPPSAASRLQTVECQVWGLVSPPAWIQSCYVRGRLQQRHAGQAQSDMGPHTGH